MEKFCSIFFIILLANPACSQTNESIGQWYLDKVMYSNGKDVAINDPFYSKLLVYTVSPGELKINSINFPASYDSNQISTDFRRMTYEIENDYLKIQDINADKIYYFLKASDFVKKYPELKLKQTIVDNDSVWIANELADYDFKNDLSFDEFISKNMISGPSKDFQNLYFQIEFILTKNSKIKNIQVLNSISNKYDNGYIRALRKTEKFLQNNSGKDLLIIKEVNHIKFYKDLTDPDEKKLYDILDEADAYYSNNDFKNAIESYSKIQALNIKNNRFKLTIKEASIRLAISYLAIDKQIEACNQFLKIGDNTDFQLRNYLNNFCK